MKKLTPNEIDRIVEAVKKAAGTVTTFSFGTAIDALYESELITALSTITLDQPQIDLNEVEKLVKYKAMITTDRESAYENDCRIYRERIGYTLSDLGTSGNNGR